MTQHLFIHGKHSHLSRYELECVYAGLTLEHGDGFSLVRGDLTVDQRTQNRLGGTVKIAEVVDGDISDLLCCAVSTGKIVFGLSVFGPGTDLAQRLSELKAKLVGKGRRGRYVNKDHENVSSGLLNQSRLLEKGVDLVLCRLGERELWGRTLTFQDIDSYSKRDYDRPARDAKVGMLPPKLAQMMINFARPEQGALIFDPFCGLGTIPMEAVLIGHRVMASDIKGRMVEATDKNLKWTCKEFGADVRLVEDVRPHDATVSFHVSSKNFHCVTEGYLGPLLERFPTAEQQMEIFETLDKIYRPFFQHLSNAGSSGNRVVFSFPFFQKVERRVFFPNDLIERYLTSGYKVIRGDHDLLYSRLHQIVGRDIVIWEKK